MTKTSLEHSLERSVLIRASASTVFGFLKDSRRFADWWGPGSRIDARPGGAVVIAYPNGVTASGEVLDVTEDQRIVFTYGYDDPGKPIPPGGSRVTISLEERAEGTLVRLRHELPDAATRDQHVPGWRYQLSVFANVAAREQHASASERVDAYFAAWGEADASVRSRSLAAVVTPDVSFRDAFGCIRGLDELAEHIGAVQVHRPSVRLERVGVVRQCQGTALADWIAVTRDGAPGGRGTNVFELGPDGRIAGAVGFWS